MTALILGTLIALGTVSWVLYPLFTATTRAVKRNPTCAMCGASPEPDAVFCSNCGAPLA